MTSVVVVSDEVLGRPRHSLLAPIITRRLIEEFVRTLLGPVGRTQFKRTERHNR